MQTYLVLKDSEGKLRPEVFITPKDGAAKNRRTHTFKEGETLVECELVEKS